MCPLFGELGYFTKITGREYSKSPAIFSVFFSSALQQAETSKLRAPK